MFLGRCLKIIGLNLSGPGEFFESKDYSCYIVTIYPGFEFFPDLSHCCQFLYENSGSVFSVCDGECLYILSLHVSFPTFVVFPSSVTCGYILVVMCLIF